MAVELRFGAYITLVRHKDMPIELVECRSCDWTGTTPDCHDATVMLTPGKQLPVGECPVCGMAAYRIIDIDVKDIASRLHALQQSEAGARAGLNAAHLRVAELERQVTKLAADLAEARYEKTS